jgi:hypothetical protein
MALVLLDLLLNGKQLRVYEGQNQVLSHVFR